MGNEMISDFEFIFRLDFVDCIRIACICLKNTCTVVIKLGCLFALLELYDVKFWWWGWWEQIVKNKVAVVRVLYVNLVQRQC